MSENKSSFMFPWEKAAMRDDDMPDGLDILDQMAYTVLRAIYKSYSSGTISRENASMQKNKLRREYERAVLETKFQSNLCYHHEKTLRMTEMAKTLCRKEPTPENALKLCDAIDSLADNDARRPVILLEQGAKCPLCEKFFEADHAARKPNYCESCGSQLGWPA